MERFFGRELPQAGVSYGESWELVDREDAQSVVVNGRFAGMTLERLWQDHREEVFGCGYEGYARFPLLIKILDAREDLSIQVHPALAVRDAEQKTEMWFVAACEPGARLYSGLREGVTRAHFEQALAEGTVADCLNVVTPRPGDAVFIPSGRVHAIGGGMVVFEIQQNSDTTYRVFDWNRRGPDGRMRDLHVAESMANIDFADHGSGHVADAGAVLADCPYFRVEKERGEPGGTVGGHDTTRFSILMVVTGRLVTADGVECGAGTTVLLPRGAAPMSCAERSLWLRISLPQ